MSGPPLLFKKDQPDGLWCGVIVAHTPRCPPSGTTMEVITFNLLPTERAIDNWAAEIIGPLGDIVYVAPDRRS